MARATADRALARGLLKPEHAEDLLGALGQDGTDRTGGPRGTDGDDGEDTR